MSEIGAYEAKTHLPRLLKRVARGERITITRHGVPVAELVPPGQGRVRPVAEVLADLQRFSRGKKLRGLSIRSLIAEGRR
jgi:prevent-host-death family protein